jgi:hypothetical protein
VLRNLVETAFNYSLPQSRPLEIAASNGSGGNSAAVIRVIATTILIPL